MLWGMVGGVVAQLLVLQWVGEGHGISRAFYWISLQHFYTSLFLLTLAPPPFLPPVPTRWSSYSFPSLVTPILLLHVPYCPLSLSQPKIFSPLMIPFKVSWPISIFIPIHKYKNWSLGPEWEKTFGIWDILLEAWNPGWPPQVLPGSSGSNDSLFILEIFSVPRS